MKNINNRIIIILALMILMVNTSCEDLLEEKPFTEINRADFYRNEADALAALSGAYAQLKSGFGYYSQVWLSNIFAASDQGLSSFQHGDFRRGTIVNTNANLTPSWTQIYVAIRDANNVIANVPSITNIDEDLKNRILGEARFLRGLHYLNLVRAFGEVPLRLAPIQYGDEPGLPVSSVVQIYNQIFSDLEFASENCWGKEEARNGYINDLGRATNTAAHALLTKAYLHVASAKRTALLGVEGNANYLGFPNESNYYYGKAAFHADRVIEAPGYNLTATLEDWMSIFDADKGNNPEMIFEIQGSSITAQGTALSNLFSPRQAGLSGGGFGGTNKLIPRFINNLIDKNDPRFINSIIHEYQDETRSYVLNDNKAGYIRTISATGEADGNLSQVFTAKYIDRSATTEYTSEQNWHVIRLADVYLMRAEALAELAGSPSIANTNINMLRSRVGMNDFDGTGMSMDDFRTAILRERAAELYMEGHRFFDLTRMGVYNEYCIIAHNETIGVRGPEDYTWPIPLSESAVNGSID